MIDLTTRLLMGAATYSTELLSNVELTRLGRVSSGADTSNYTIASLGQDYGDSGSDRHILLYSFAHANFNRTINWVTIAGNPATEVLNWTAIGGGVYGVVGIHYVHLPTGNGDLVVQYSGNMVRFSGQAYVIRGEASPQFNVETNVATSGNTNSVILNTPAGAAVIAQLTGGYGSNTTMNWSGLATTFPRLTIEGSSQISDAHETFAVSDPNKNISTSTAHNTNSYAMLSACAIY